MRDDIKDAFKIGALSLITLFSILFPLFITLRGIEVYFIQNYIVTVRVNDELVYNGKICGIAVESSGSTTKVLISGGFLYLFPQKYFVSNNVKIEGERK